MLADRGRSSHAEEGAGFNISELAKLRDCHLLNTIKINESVISDSASFQFVDSGSFKHHIHAHQVDEINEV